MTTFLEFIRKLPGLPKSEADSPEREQWLLLVGEHLVGLYRKLYAKPLSYLRRQDIEAIDDQSGNLISLHVAYDWTFLERKVVQAAVLAFDGTPVSAWRKDGHDADWDALIVLDMNTSKRLASWVYEFAAREALLPVTPLVRDVHSWLWQDNVHLTPTGNEDSFFYTVINPQALQGTAQLVTPTTYVPSIDSGLLPVYSLGAIQTVLNEAPPGIAAIAHTLNGPRSVDVKNLVHSVVPEEQMRGDDLEDLQKLVAMDDYWFLQTFSAWEDGWACTVGVHRRGKAYLQWYNLHWTEQHRQKAIKWSLRVGERQSGSFDSDVIASIGWQLGKEYAAGFGKR